ncbi:MAG: sigma-70 family RNA polymerase sigma factor [Mesorhizobium sp.]|nr:sigma-70 family RNA polymerase sigma factor [Mesorhizobium sp.]
MSMVPEQPVGQPSGDAEMVKLLPALRAFARTFHRDRDEADDLVQETLSKGLSNMHQFRPGTSMKSWLFTIMRNTFYTQVKRNQRESPGAADCISAKPSTNPTQEWSARGKEVAAALQRLPQEQREIVILVGVLGQSYEEASEICGCAMGTVKSRLNRARLRLLQELREETVSTALTSSDRHPVNSPSALRG